MGRTIKPITLKYTELAQLLLPVLPHVESHRYNTLPILECVHLEVRAGHLTATATDRYTAAISRVKLGGEDAPAEWSAALHHSHIKGLLAMFKPARHDMADSTVTLTHTGDAIRAEGGGVLFSSASVEYRLSLGEYPNVSSIFEERLTAKPEAEPFAINAKLLAKFAVAVGNLGDPLEVRSTSRNRPTIVTVGDRFLGAIMPMRISTEPEPVAWAEFLAPRKVKAVTA